MQPLQPIMFDSVRWTADHRGLEMGNPGKLAKMRLPAILSAIGLAVAGCAHAPIYEAQLNSSLAPHAAQLRSEAVVAGASDAAPVLLDDLLTLATSRHPELRAARAKVEAAAGVMIQAG